MKRSSVLRSVPMTKFSVLIAGYINVNVIDGSAFFLAGICSMCAGQPNIDVTLVTANPISRTEVLEEVLPLPNVDLVDPYVDRVIQSSSDAPTGSSMSREKYAQIVGRLAESRKHDAILIRDTETAFHFVSMFPHLANRLALYVTGISSLESEPSGEIVDQVEFVVSSGAKILCQTVEMAEVLCSSTDLLDIREIGVLSPHVPDSSGTFEELFHFAENPSKLAYTGKFFKDWNADLILSAFKSTQHRRSELTLDVAGDQFKRDPQDRFFVDNVSYLLQNTPGVTWHGRLPRRLSRDLIQKSDVGVGWRSSVLDSSTEVSTKILEYGVLARPSILNRTVLHEKLLGSDYPLFVNSIADYKNLLFNLPDMSADVEEAAKRCFYLAQKYTYSSILPGFLSVFKTPETGDNEIIVPWSGQVLEELLGQGVDLDDFAEARVEGAWLIFEFSDSSPKRVRELGAEAETLLLSWRATLDRLQHADRPRVEGACFARAVPDLDIAKQKTENALKELSGALAREKKDAEGLRDKNLRLEATVGSLEERLAALRQSKLGKLQRFIWNARKASR